MVYPVERGEIRSQSYPLPVSNRLSKLFIMGRQWLFQFVQGSVRLNRFGVLTIREV
jgi:hypothetical protein